MKTLQTLYCLTFIFYSTASYTYIRRVAVKQLLSNRQETVLQFASESLNNSELWFLGVNNVFVNRSTSIGVRVIKTELKEETLNLPQTVFPLSKEGTLWTETV